MTRKHLLPAGTGLAGGGVGHCKDQPAWLQLLHPASPRDHLSRGHAPGVLHLGWWIFREFFFFFFCLGGCLHVLGIHLRKKRTLQNNAQLATFLDYWTPGHPGQTFQTGAQLCCC